MRKGFSRQQGDFSRMDVDLVEKCSQLVIDDGEEEIVDLGGSISKESNDKLSLKMTEASNRETLQY